MGQLEKYGLYVLCLVIFLILGVAIWGEPEPAIGSRSGSAAVTPANQQRTDPEIDLDALMSPVPKPAGVKKPAPAAADRDLGIDDGTLPVAPSNGPNGPITAEPPSRPSYTIRSGDTLEAIAKQRLGDVRHVSLLRDLNPKLQPERLKIGQTIVLPSAAELTAPDGAGKDRAGKDRASVQPTTAGGTKADGGRADAADGKSADGAARTYRVERGDTLEGLAKRFFGKDYFQRIQEIKQLNPTVDPARLRIGQLIKIPGR